MSLSDPESNDPMRNQIYLYYGRVLRGTDPLFKAKEEARDKELQEAWKKRLDFVMRIEHPGW